MPKLWVKAKREMRAGSVFVSCGFAVPGVDADLILEAGDRRGRRLHVWRMPGPVTSRVAPDRAA
jgi:hypothetical protein